MANWLGVATPENYALNFKTRTWGVSDRSLDRIKRVRVGDNLVIHVPPMRCGGIFRVTKPHFHAEKPIWPDSPYPHRIRIEPVIVPPRPVDIRRAFTMMIGTNPAGYFRVGFREIPDHEFEAFRDFLESGRVETLEPTTLEADQGGVQSPSSPGEGGKLVEASSTTLGWLEELRGRVARRNPSLVYGVSKYWASFKSPDTNRNICSLSVQRNQIRLFTRLEVNEDRDLQPTPASQNWARWYPAIFLVRSQGDIQKGVELILRSYDRDLEMVKQALEGEEEPTEPSMLSPAVEASGFALSLERDLEDYLAGNLGDIEPGLKLYTDGDTTGRQFATDVGRIDLLALDASGAFVVIEAKAGVADRAVLGQILPYMAWVEDNLAKGKPVRGIIVASDFAPALPPTVKKLPMGLALCKYWAEFRFKRIT